MIGNGLININTMDIINKLWTNEKFRLGVWMILTAAFFSALTNTYLDVILAGWLGCMAWAMFLVGWGLVISEMIFHDN